MKARILGRYALHAEIGAGGMATVHLGRLVGIGGFSRPVAIKRLRPSFARDPTFVTMLLDEARLASRVQHPNVVSTLDVGTEEGETFLVLDYVHGEPLSKLIPAAAKHGGVPPDVAVAILVGALRGLHAAHEAKDKSGAPLGLVHRDVSPPNVMVGADGLARVLDFGVAKAEGRLQQTRGGQVKGKLSYMAREQLLAEPIDRRADVFAASVVLWETLAGKRLFPDQTRIGADVAKVPPPSTVAPGVPEDLDSIVLCGLADRPDDRFSTAEAMAVALETAVRPASVASVAAWVERVAGAALAERAALVAQMERDAEPSFETQSLAAVPAAAAIVMPRTVPDIGPPLLPPSTVDEAPVLELPAPPTRRESKGGTRALPIVVIGAVSLVAGVAMALGLSRGGRTASPSAAANPSSSAAPYVATADPVETVPSSAPSSSTPPSATASARPARKPPPPKKSRPACDPPFRVDENGIKHPKPECF